MLKEEWVEMRPYQPENENADETNTRKILDHVDKFLMAFVRTKDGTIRTFIRTAIKHRVTLDALDGLEAVISTGPNISGFSNFRKYRTKRHCAMMITPAEMERTSIYQILGHEVGKECCLLFYARKTSSPQPINEFVRSIDRGINPESISRFWSSGNKKKISQRLRSKMQEANKKLQTRNLFLCKMYVCSQASADSRAIEGVFPTNAFKKKETELKSVRKAISSSISIPMLGGSHMLILSDAEIMGFISMPDATDVAKVNFEFGQLRSKSAGLPEGNIT